jgi:hypothetical protein
MEYCTYPDRIEPMNKEIETVQEALQRALTVLVNNHGVYAECYMKQRELIDAINRRTTSQTSS